MTGEIIREISLYAARNGRSIRVNILHIIPVSLHRKISENLLRHSMYTIAPDISPINSNHLSSALFEIYIARYTIMPVISQNSMSWTATVLSETEKHFRIDLKISNTNPDSAPAPKQKNSTQSSWSFITSISAKESAKQSGTL